MNLKIFNNSIINVVGAIFNALFVIIVPAIIVKHLNAESFTLWNLAMQVILYVNFLGLGLQTAIARSVSFQNGSADTENKKINLVFIAAKSITNWIFLSSAVFLILFIYFYPKTISSVSGDLIVDFRWLITFFGISAIFQILSQPYMGIFQGMERNIVFVTSQIFTKIIAICLLYLGVVAEASVVQLAIIFGASTALLFPAMYMNFKLKIKWAQNIKLVKLDKEIRRDILRFCGSLSVWSICMLAINSVGILMVGWTDFSMVSSYAIASTVALGMSSLLGAALSPLMTTASNFYASSINKQKLPDLLNKISLAYSLFLGLIVFCVILMGEFFLRLWIGEELAAKSLLIVFTLVCTHCIRNMAAPYSLMLLATGMHRRALVTSIFEALVTVLLVVCIGAKYGAAGVAFACLLGGVLGVVANFIFNLRKTPEITPQPVKFLLLCTFIPIIIFVPLCYFIIQYL